MKAFRVPRPCEPSRLHSELVAAGVPVVTIRACSTDDDVLGLAVCAVVVTEDSAPLNTPAIIAAHIESRTPKPLPPGADINRSMETMEKI
jgi:hypothetical protein